VALNQSLKFVVRQRREFAGLLLQLFGRPHAVRRPPWRRDFVIRRVSLTDAPEGRARDAAAGVNFIRVPSSCFSYCRFLLRRKYQVGKLMH
jgi:hypothetical protein